MIAIIIIAAIAIVGIAFLINAVKIVRPFQRGLVERLGRYKTTKEPGFNLIIPFIETMQLVDMREQVVDVPPQEVITSDNVVVSVDAVVYYEATDPQRLVYNVANFFTAITKLAQTNLRNLIGDLELDTALDVARPHQHCSCARCSTTPPTSGACRSCASRSSASTRRRRSSRRCTPRCAPSAIGGRRSPRPAGSRRRRSPAPTARSSR